MQPLPEDAEADFARRHVLHQVQDVIVSEVVGRLERRGLQALAKSVPILHRDAEEIPRAADRAGGGFEHEEAVRIGLGVRQPRTLETHLIGLPDLLPNRPDDVNHLPVGDPLAARALALFPLGPGNRALHAAGDAGR